MDSPGLPPDTPVDPEEALYPCKGCGEILEEGKAFELAGNRWHINCFRCNTCGTLLDSDANLLLLGDGSLICNNCTYSCSACGNKIEDLAILTGDQAFCASCFKCRNCKRKIENLRYARTSQGIFCMQCHESLMARRRKRTKEQPRTTSTNSNGSSGPTDKSLPALPSHIAPQSALSDTVESPISPTAQTPTELSPLPQHTLRSRKDNVADLKREAPALGFEEFKENLGLPAGSLPDPRKSETSSHSESRPSEDNFLPIALDTGLSRPPMNRARSSEDKKQSSTKPGQYDTRFRGDDFSDLLAGSSASRSGSTDRRKGRMSPTVSQGPLARQQSSDRVTGLRRGQTGPNGESPPPGNMSPQMGARDRFGDQHASSTTADPQTADSDRFTLSDAPKVRRRSSGARKAPKDAPDTTPTMTLAGQTEGTRVVEQGASIADTDAGAPPPPGRKASARRSPLPPAPPLTEPTNRDDHAGSKPSITRKELPASAEPIIAGSAIPRRELSVNDPAKRQGITNMASPRLNNSNSDDSFSLPPRSSSRPAVATPGLQSAAMSSDAKGDFTTPREAPAPPSAPPSRNAGGSHRPNESVTSIQSEQFNGPKSASSNYEPSAEDEDLARREEALENPGLFRKMSKAVKHGRSASDKIGASPKWHKSRNGSIDISSPMIASPEGTEDTAQLRNQLRFSQQRVAELETEKLSLQGQVDGSDIRQVNVELREKRSTMAFLDTQREMVIRELESMTDQLTKAKESQTPLDLESMKSGMLKDFASQLQTLKASLADQIEDLVRKKNELTNEIANLIQMKDKGFQEYESLTTRNNQLREYNRQLLDSIKSRQVNGASAPGPNPNALGIYTATRQEPQMEYRSALSIDGSAASQLSGETEVDPGAVMTAPHVVNIRKGQPKKFSWKKGSESMAKNVKKGFKGAFATEKSTLREEQFIEGIGYSDMRQGEAPTIGDKPVGQRNGSSSERGAGVISGEKGWTFLTQKGGPNKKGDGAYPSLPADSSLFGSDLTARCDFERRVIPALVTRCIEEVEMRGMDAEGIYRKSGSYSQVKSVQQGFEKDSINFDISDPDLDIHAVTSALKQYLRKLPNPLITFECYDDLLEAAQDESDKSRVPAMRRAVERLPKRHRETLEYLMFHLVRVMGREKDNLMSALNLAVVFAPTIMRPASLEREMSDMELQRKAVQAMLVDHRHIFADDSGGD